MTGIETATRITRDKIRAGGIRLHRVRQDSIGIRMGVASETRTQARLSNGGTGNSPQA
jgi:hypothetical protein